MSLKYFLPIMIIICLVTNGLFAQTENNFTLIEPVSKDNILAGSKSESAADDESKVLWIFKVFNFGVVEFNEPVTAEFNFTNHSDRPFIIASAQGSCGCTNVTYPEEPIFPGEAGKVTATFNSKDIGPFKKTVNVLEMGSNKEITLYLQGEVVWSFN